MGHRIGRITTVGAFAGSTPDPSSWSYNPNQQIAGTSSAWKTEILTTSIPSAPPGSPSYNQLASIAAIRVF